MKIPPIYFYMHPQVIPAEQVPEDADVNWSGYTDFMRKSGSGSKFAINSYCWILQTFLHLRKSVPCQFTSTIPDEGIIIGQRTELPFNLKPKPKQLIICVKADCELHHFAQLHVVQNPQDARAEDAYFIPLWSQSGLIKRDKNRGQKFENIAFFGVNASLAPELTDPTWSEQLKSMGLNWQVVAEKDWHDYSDKDAVIAVRSFTQNSYQHKPATKLYNSWLAGVPAILGPDSAFRAERQSELDYIEVNSIDETITALKLLRDNSELYKAMVKNGETRGEKFATENLIGIWEKFLTETAIPAYYRWCGLSKLQQKVWLAKKQLIVTENNLRPNPYYPYESDTVNNNHINVQDSVLISSMQVYRNVKKLIAR